MSRIRRSFLLLVPALAALVLLIAACEPADNDVDPAPPVDTPAPTEPTPLPTPADPAPTPEPAPTDGEDDFTADVEEIDGSGITGEVTARGMNGDTEFMVSLSGLDENEMYTHGIFEGSCADLDGGLFNDDEDGQEMDFPVHPFDELIVDMDGNAEHTETVMVNFDDIRTGHYYAVHVEGATADDGGSAVACADLDDNGLFDFGDDDEDDDDANGTPTPGTTN